MDGVVFRKDGIEFQLNDFEFSFDANGNFIARHTVTGNELTFTTDGNVQADALEASDELGNPTYATLGDVPTTLPEGAQVYVQDEDRIYVEDGT
jgi:hypothetical protein